MTVKHSGRIRESGFNQSVNIDTRNERDELYRYTTGVTTLYVLVHHVYYLLYGNRDYASEFTVDIGKEFIPYKIPIINGILDQMRLFMDSCSKLIL